MLIGIKKDTQATRSTVKEIKDKLLVTDGGIVGIKKDTERINDVKDGIDKIFTEVTTIKQDILSYLKNEVTNSRKAEKAANQEKFKFESILSDFFDFYVIFTFSSRVVY